MQVEILNREIQSLCISDAVNSFSTIFKFHLQLEVSETIEIEACVVWLYLSIIMFQGGI